MGFVYAGSNPIVLSPILKMKSGSLLALLLGISITLEFAAQAHAYAPLGHEIVGAIADERLANTPTAVKIRALVGNLSLEKAALLADMIKGKIAEDRKSTRLNSSHRLTSRMPSSA